MKRIAVIPALLILFAAGHASAAACVIPPGTYTFLSSSNGQTYYFNDTLTILATTNDKVLKTGDFSVNVNGNTYQRTGDRFTYINNNGSYTSLKNGPITYTPGPQQAAMAAALPPGTAYPAPEGVYTKQADGSIIFVGATKLPDLVITESNCGAGTVYTLDGVTADLNAKAHDSYIEVDLNSDVLFDFGSSAISAQAAQNLDKLVFLANEKRQGKIVVRGYTDAVGTNDANLKLSNARAQAVVAYLVAHGGPASADLYLAQGLGEDYPVAANTNPDGSDNPQGRALNRRVEVLIQTVKDAPVPEPVRVIQGSSGASITTNSDGSQVLKGSNGANITQGSDGTTTLHTSSGKTITRGADGSLIIQRP